MDLHSVGGQGRERQWTISLDGKPYRLLEDENGIPAWQEKILPATAGKDIELFQREKRWDTWHLGMGYHDIALAGAYSKAAGADARFPRQICTGPDEMTVTDPIPQQINAFFEQSGALYYVTDRYCRHLVFNADESVADSIETLGTAPYGSDGCDFDDNAAFSDGTGHTASIGVNFDGSTFIGMTNNKKIFKFTGTAWSVGTATYGSYMTKFWSDNAGTDNLGDWVLVGVNNGASQVAVCSQGAEPTTSGNWSGATQIGDTTTAITALAGRDRTAWIGKTDGLYYLDLTRTPVVVETKVINANNGKNLMVDPMGIVYYPCQEAYYRYDPSTGEVWDVSPGRGLPNNLSLGPVTAQTTYRGWIYVTTWDGTTSYLLSGRLREQGEPGIGPIVWHGGLDTYAQKITAMHVTGLTTTPRLYLGDTAGNVRHYKLPLAGDNPTLNTTYRYETAGDIYLSFDNWGVPGSKWQLTSLEFDTFGMTATTYVDAYLYFDGVNSVVMLASQATTSPRQVITIPNTATTLSAALTSGATSMTVASITGWPSRVLDQFYARIDSEVVRITAGANTTTWTISRGQRGTTAAAHSAGATVTPDYTFTTVQIRLVFTLASTTTVAYVKGVNGYAVQRPDLYTLIEAQVYCASRVLSEMRLKNRYTGADQLENLRTLQESGYVQLEDWIDGIKRTRTVLVGPVSSKVVRKEGVEAADQVALLQIAVIA